jgi:hypothetical protein
VVAEVAGLELNSKHGFHIHTVRPPHAFVVLFYYYCYYYYFLVLIEYFSIFFLSPQQYGDLSSTDGSSVGSHWNPTGAKHHVPETTPRHVGDLGNIQSYDSATGLAHFNYTTTNIPDVHSLLGRAVRHPRHHRHHHHHYRVAQCSQLSVPDVQSSGRNPQRQRSWLWLRLRPSRYVHPSLSLDVRVCVCACVRVCVCACVRVCVCDDKKVRGEEC